MANCNDNNNCIDNLESLCSLVGSQLCVPQDSDKIIANVEATKDILLPKFTDHNNILLAPCKKIYMMTDGTITENESIAFMFLGTSAGFDKRVRTPYPVHCQRVGNNPDGSRPGATTTLDKNMNPTSNQRCIRYITLESAAGKDCVRVMPYFPVYSRKRTAIEQTQLSIFNHPGNSQWTQIPLQYISIDDLGIANGSNGILIPCKQSGDLHASVGYRPTSINPAVTDGYMLVGWEYNGVPQSRSVVKLNYLASILLPVFSQTVSRELEFQQGDVLSLSVWANTPVEITSSFIELTSDGCC
jgi:hypothetical protein